MGISSPSTKVCKPFQGLVESMADRCEPICELSGFDNDFNSICKLSLGSAPWQVYPIAYTIVIIMEGALPNESWQIKLKSLSKSDNPQMGSHRSAMDSTNLEGLTSLGARTWDAHVQAPCGLPNLRRSRSQAEGGPLDSRWPRPVREPVRAIYARRVFLCLLRRLCFCHLPRNSGHFVHIFTCMLTHVYKYMRNKSAWFQTNLIKGNNSCWHHLLSLCVDDSQRPFMEGCFVFVIAWFLANPSFVIICCSMETFTPS
jgi:hypothetical protein